MRNIRTAAAAVAVTLSTVLALAACSAPAEPAPESPEATESERDRVSLTVGYIDTSINGVGVIAAANELDLWEAAGIDVELVPFTNGPTQIQAMAAGSLDVGYIGGGATWLPMSGQATIIVPNESTFGDYLIASPASGATSIEDLAGLRVGVPDGGSGEMILTLALEEAGLSMDDIERIPLDPPNVVSAFVAGQIDVAAIFSPLSDQIFESVPDAEILANNRDFPQTEFVGAWVASNQAVEEKSDAVSRFLEVYAQVNDYRIENTEEIVAWAAAESGAPESGLQGQADNLEWWPSDQILADNESGATVERFVALQELFLSINRLETAGDPAVFVNTELFNQAMEALGR